MMLETIFADVQRWALAHFSRWKRVAQWALCDKKKQHWTTSVDRTEKWIPWADILPVVSYISRQLWCLPSPKGGAGQCSSSYRHWALKIPRGEQCHGGGGGGGRTGTCYLYHHLYTLDGSFEVKKWTTVSRLLTKPRSGELWNTEPEVPARAGSLYNRPLFLSMGISKTTAWGLLSFSQ